VTLAPFAGTVTHIVRSRDRQRPMPSRSRAAQRRGGGGGDGSSSKQRQRPRRARILSDNYIVPPRPPGSGFRMASGTSISSVRPAGASANLQREDISKAGRQRQRRRRSGRTPKSPRPGRAHHSQPTAELDSGGKKRYITSTTANPSPARLPGTAPLPDGIHRGLTPPDANGGDWSAKHRHSASLPIPNPSAVANSSTSRTHRGVFDSKTVSTAPQAW